MDKELKVVTFLPIGSIVTVGKSDKKLMITGFCISPKNNEKKEVFDYIACFWPEGIIDTDKNLLFNHNDIREVLAEGYSDEEEFQFKRKLNPQILKTKEDFDKVEQNKEV